MAKHWEVQLDVVKDCSKGPKKQVVWLGRLAKLKIDLLMKRFKNQEWLAYLLGDEYRVADIFIPIQRASETFVGNVECEEYNKLRVIGVMHSHHKMQIDFSGHDHDFINSNHNLSLLANMNGNKSYQITGQARIQVPCGALYIVPADVKLDLEVDGFDKSAFMEEVDKKVNPPREEPQLPQLQCTPTVCYCGNWENCKGWGLVPLHAKTFPTHSSDCPCTACVRDRREYREKCNRQKEKIWTTEPEKTEPEKTDYSYTTEGAWVCEECSKLNYESEGERLEECVWCNSPREDEEKDDAEEEKEIIAIEDLIDGIKEDLEEFNSLAAIDPENKIKFQSRKYLDIEEDLANEQILDRAIQKVSKYLFLIKRLDEGGYKQDLDHFVSILSVDYAEKEESLRDEIASIILELEDQLEEKNLKE